MPQIGAEVPRGAARRDPRSNSLDLNSLDWNFVFPSYDMAKLPPILNEWDSNIEKQHHAGLPAFVLIGDWHVDLDSQSDMACESYKLIHTTLQAALLRMKSQNFRRSPTLAKGIQRRRNPVGPPSSRGPSSGCKNV